MLLFAVSACGKVGKPSYDATAENNGTYVQLGPIEYQLQVSRELNPYAAEDHGYLVGLPSGQKAPTSNQIWYGVFIYARNTSSHSSPLATDFSITDTQGNTYKPLPLKASVNEFAWTGGDLSGDGSEPAPNTTAYFGPTQGGLLLFQLNTSVYNNRPVTLQIKAPGISHTATISLDL